MKKIAASCVGICFAAVLTLSMPALAGSNSATSAHMGPWGEQGDEIVAGDFDKDGYVDDLAIHHGSQWSFDFDHNGNTDNVYEERRQTAYPSTFKFVSGDFDHDGYVNDIGEVQNYISEGAPGGSQSIWIFYTFFQTGGTMRLSELPTRMVWGLKGDLPVSGDFDLDGCRDDVAVYRSSDKTWHFNTDLDGTTDRTVEFNDWADIAEFFDDRDNTPSTSIGPRRTTGSANTLRRSEDLLRLQVDDFGDIPIAGDFNGDHEVSDLGIFRASNRLWYLDYDKNGDIDRTTGPWAYRGDLPISGDFDRDGYSDDLGVFRPSTGMWYFQYQDYHWSAPGMEGIGTHGTINS
jgi:hypothetical protein